jgi:hypothetical protein
MNLYSKFPYVLTDLDEIRHRRAAHNAVEDWRKKAIVCLGGGGEITFRLYFLYLSIDLDKIRYMRCPQKSI